MADAIEVATVEAIAAWFQSQNPIPWMAGGEWAERIRAGEWKAKP